MKGIVTLIVNDTRIDLPNLITKSGTEAIANLVAAGVDGTTAATPIKGLALLSPSAVTTLSSSTTAFPAGDILAFTTTFDTDDYRVATFGEGPDFSVPGSPNERVGELVTVGKLYKSTLNEAAGELLTIPTTFSGMALLMGSTSGAIPTTSSHKTFSIAKTTESVQVDSGASITVEWRVFI